MSLDRKDELLRDKADRALGNHQVPDAMRKVRAIIGPQNIPDSELLAQSALNKLHQGEKPTTDELMALEIVVRLLRPVVFSRNGGLLDDLPENNEHKDLYSQELKDAWSAFRNRIGSMIGSIGRVEIISGTHIGTGFLVADGLVATNRHVLAAMTFGAEVLAPGAARIVFKQETDAANEPEDIAPIAGVAAIHPTLDMALLAISKQGRPFVELDSVIVSETTRVVTVGYPADDPVNNPLFLSAVFNGKFGVKRAAIGEVLDGTESPTVFHDCSTTRGNSGSPVFSLASGLVSGIHRAGYFMYRNDAVDAVELQKFVQGAKP
jgi:S1-C subfamily serine protease